jgi:predicted permease
MSLFRHLTAWLRRGRLDDELRDELAQHLEWKVEGLIADGVTEAEARRRAAVDVGNLTRLREQSRAVWGFPSLDSILQDVRYGLRILGRSPGFSAIAILSLAIGIGSSAAVFSLADGVLFRPLAVRDPHGLVVIKWTSGQVFPFSSLNGYGQQNDAGLASTSFSYAAYDAFRSSGHLDVLGFADLDRVNVGIDGHAEVGTAHAVSGNYFDVLGVVPALGRPILAADDRDEASPAAVISHRLWQRRFGGAPDVVGRTLILNSVPFTIAGVAPSSFHGTGQVGTDPDLYVSLAMHVRVLPNDDPVKDPNFWWVLMLGRLKPGARPAEARDALDVLLKRTVAAAKPALLAKDLPRLELLPGYRGQVEEREDMRDPLRTMAIVTGIVLLVACANVAGLLLARGRARLRELSVRVAIGAPRSRVVRQLVTEAALLSATGTGLGMALAQWMSQSLAPALSTGTEPLELVTQLDVRVLAFAVLTACACVMLFGLLPAFRATDINLTAGLQEAARGAAAAPRRRVLSGGLVVVQIALSVTLVAGAGLLVRSVDNLQHVSLGFDPMSLLLFRIDPSLNGYEGARAIQLYDSVLDRLRGMPGVAGATLSSHKLISNSSVIGAARRLDETAPEPGSADMRAFARKHTVWQLTVDDRFFSTMRLNVIRGRTFAASDTGGAPVALINRMLARQLFQTDDVVGRQFSLGSFRRSGDEPITVIGVTADARYTSLRAEMPPTAYLYYRQRPDMKNPVTFEVKTAVPPSALSTAVREAVRQVDPNVPIFGMMTQSDQITTSLRQERLFARLATMLGVVAVLLSAIGLYGLLAYAVVRRTPEIGIRMALGAARGTVQWMMLRESLALVAIGLVLGVPAALAGTRLLGAMLFGLAPRDPVTLAGAAATMLVLGVLAGYLPARKASRVDPLVALRAE